MSKPITARSAECGHVLLLTLIGIAIFAVRIKGIFTTFVEAASLKEKVEFLSIFKVRFLDKAGRKQPFLKAQTVRKVVEHWRLYYVNNLFR